MKVFKNIYVCYFVSRVNNDSITYICKYCVYMELNLLLCINYACMSLAIFAFTPVYIVTAMNEAVLCHLVVHLVPVY